MRRLLAITAAVAALAALVVLGTGASDGGRDPYLVRAEFRNASFVIPGEDVRVAGVTVGKVKELDVSPAQRAVIVLEITHPGFTDFRKDAECSIRPQSLIGEKFVECAPTQPRAVGERPAPPLDVIRDGRGKGQRFLPVERTSRAVDPDLVNNVMRLPYRQRLAIILNELGAGVAGRGEDLNRIIRTADPALKETDRVLKLLGEQNEVLADLARDSDAVLAPLARDRARVAGFIEGAGRTAQATAERRADLERTIQRLPTFLRELRPTMHRLGALSDEMTPVLRDLRGVAPELNRFMLELGPFSSAATPAFRRLGRASDVGRDALVGSRPVIGDLRTFARTAKPVAEDLRALTTSLRDTGGIERLMDFIFYQVAAINGFDRLGHYLRAILVVNLCSTYATESDPACSANFVPPEEDEASASSARSARAALAARADGRSPGLARLDAVLRGMSPDEALGRTTDGEKRTGAGDRDRGGGRDDALAMPPQVLPGAPSPSAQDDAQAAPPASGAGPGQTPAPGSGPSAPGGASGSLLDYLLGDG